jgi:hypothetical protein
LETHIAYLPVEDVDKWVEVEPSRGPIDSDGDGIVSVVEEYQAAADAVDRFEVLRAAVSTLTDEAAQACGFTGRHDVEVTLAEFDRRLAVSSREIGEDIAGRLADERRSEAVKAELSIHGAA